MKLLFGFAISILFSAPALAQGYGMAGCGLGSIVANQVGLGNGFMQVFAATTNGSSASQTFGISSGTSNCNRTAATKPKSKKRAEKKVFLHYNMAHVKVDAARGEGDYIASLADLFGCQNQLTGSYDAFANLSRQHHQNIFNSDSADVVLSNYENIITSEKLSCAQS